MEEPLPAGGSCLLGSLNLSEFVMNPFTKNSYFDFDSFEEAVKTAVEGLNEVLEEGLPLHPLQEQRDSVNNWRQIGLGIMGLADCLLKLGIKYGSEEAVETCDLIGFTMADKAIEISSLLAHKNGYYPKYKKSVLNSPYFLTNTTDDTKKLVLSYGLRNSQLLTIAPTGTLSTMLGISGGIEPIFATHYNRTTKSLHGEDVVYKVYTPIVKEYIERNNLKDESELPDYFITAMDLDYKARVNIQSIWQTHIDASISSTVNVPNDFTVNETEKLYEYAWEKGLKGITIYRTGCAREGILTFDTPKEENTLERGEVIQVSDNLIGKKRKLTTGCGSLHCIALFDPDTGELRETYLSKGSTGGCNNFMVGLSRMISISARGGISIEDIVDQLNSTGSCPSYATRRAVKKDTSKGSCCPMAVGNALMDMYREIQEELKDKKKENNNKKEEKPEVENKTVCPECGEPLVFEEGCNICKNCGWSKCL